MFDCQFLLYISIKKEMLQHDKFLFKISHVYLEMSEPEKQSIYSGLILSKNKI